MKIALLGAESTGKTALAQALLAHGQLCQRQVLWVPEYLREWCDAAGRTPLAHEQALIAQTQAERALAAPTCDWLLVDTTPLMTAVYSDLLFADRSLYESALAHQTHYDLTLLMGLDLPWVADGLQRDGPQVRLPVDTRLRHALLGAGIRFSVIYGWGADRSQAALRAMDHCHGARPTLTAG